VGVLAPVARAQIELDAAFRAGALLHVRDERAADAPALHVGGDHERDEPPDRLVALGEREHAQAGQADEATARRGDEQPDARLGVEPGEPAMWWRSPSWSNAPADEQDPVVSTIRAPGVVPTRRLVIRRWTGYATYATASSRLRPPMRSARAPAESVAAR
jgi:hypothetical protein